jgi:hypothetical protein
MGLANIELKRGAATTEKNSSTITSKSSRLRDTTASQASKSKNAEEVDLEEAIFAFSKAPDEQIGRAIKGGGTGAKVRLEQSQAGNKGRVIVSLAGKDSMFDVAENLGREVKVENTPFVLKIDNYWADFRIQDGKPSSLTDLPNNPAVLVTIHGKGVPVATPATTNPHGANTDETNPRTAGKELTTNGGPPTMPAAGGEAPNHLTLFIADDGAITYELISRKSGKSTGKIEMNKPLTTGWADWQLVVDKVMPQAEQWMDFNPVMSETTSTSTPNELPDGVQVRVEQSGEKFEQWVPAGWQITVPIRHGTDSPGRTSQEVMIAYGWRIIPLPIGLELVDFEVKRNEGNDSPAGFKSTLRVSTAEGESGMGQCWMNNPFSFPGAWWRTWTGLTYKISQASWNPENLNQSSVQILRDPGWLLKWIGSLLVVSGVFMMFYLRPYRKQTVGEPITPNPKVQKIKRVRAPVPEVMTH